MGRTIYRLSEFILMVNASGGIPFRWCGISRFGLDR
jgi:hypothetical protein